MNPKTCADDFYAKDQSWGQAHEILAEGCEIPPSLEVFEHGLEVTRERSRQAVTVQQYARSLVDAYRRIPL